MAICFEGSFTQQESIPVEGIEAAVRVMRSGRLHRYNMIDGEQSETGLLEAEFAAQMGAKFALAVASGGYAMATAMRAIGVKPGDKVLTNAFTLAPVPGSIASVGAVPVFVGVTDQLVIDLKDLKAKIQETGAQVLLLSHMRGHLCDMDVLMQICDSAGVQVIEDCAHTMGASWQGILSGRHGVFGCYSCQTYKHVNSGEGGLLVSDDAEAMARATMLSGSYMLYDRHPAGPPESAFKTIRYETPNVSGRMDNLRAAILRPQLRDLDCQIERWAARYAIVESALLDATSVTLIERPEDEVFVGSSIQFLLLDFSEQKILTFVDRCAKRGVELKWFGGSEPTGFTSRYDSWRYVQSDRMPESDRILKAILDMRLPLTFSEEDCSLIGQIICEEVQNAS